MAADSLFLYHLETLTAKEKVKDSPVLIFRSSLCRATHICWEKKCILAGMRSLLSFNFGVFLLSINFGVLSLKVSSAVLL